MRRQFHKMHGLGNDFVIVDAREQAFDVTPVLARAIADRRRGVGCDQLIVLEPSDSADLRMRIWNSDGGEVESCGNATRCVVQLTGARRIDSDGGLLEGMELGGEVEVTLGEPRFGWNEIPLAYPMDTAALPMAWDGLESPMALNVGNPHLVFFVPDAREVPLEIRGPGSNAPWRSRAEIRTWSSSCRWGGWCGWRSWGRVSNTTLRFPSASTSTSPAPSTTG